MGRKGMKGFLKSVHKKHDSDEVEDDAQEKATTSTITGAAAAAAAPASTAAEEKEDIGASGNADEEGEDGHKGPEKRGQMLQRHKREMLAHKKAMQKLGKGKKDEVAKLTQEMEDRHARELKELEQREAEEHKQQQVANSAADGADGASSCGEAAAAQEAAGVVAGLSLESKAGGQKPSKAQKRREKHAQQEAEREARIAEEQAGLGPSDKALEEERLQQLLVPLRLSIREMRADGHCLYRAVADQLQQQQQPAPPAAQDFSALRTLAAAHIRAHPNDFTPFIYDEDQPGGPDEQLEAYCAELEGTAAWGGQLELGALAQALERQIKVYAVGLPPVTLGDEHADKGVLQLCYLRHAFGLGEHYNSVEPLAADAAEEGEAVAAVQ